MDFSDFEFNSNNEWFSNETKTNILSLNMIEEEGETILREIVAGYENQIGNYKFVNNNQADIIFRVKRIDVKRRRFTFNFLKPGPIYFMIIETEIIEAGNVSIINRKKSLTNMAVVAFPDDNIKWMSQEEKGYTENQLKTFRVGLRKLYQNIYFDAFDISLRL